VYLPPGKYGPMNEDHSKPGLFMKVSIPRLHPFINAMYFYWDLAFHDETLMNNPGKAINKIRQQLQHLPKCELVGLPFQSAFKSFSSPFSMLFY
jgi:hypothetical protein